MLVWWLYAALCCAVPCIGREFNVVPKTSIAIDENAKLVIFGTRHGNRHPGRFLKENPRVWGFEGDYELTQVRPVLQFISHAIRIIRNSSFLTKITSFAINETYCLRLCVHLRLTNLCRFKIQLSVKKK